jgi:beta-N-acetylhexosaminidase
VFSHLTEPQRVGQLFFLGLAGDAFGPNEANAERTDHFGSVTFIQTTTVGAAGVRAVADAAQAAATKQATGGVRMFVAVNQEGGQIQALRGSGFETIPPATVQGTLDAATLRTDAKQWGEQLTAAGVNMNFAPVLDVLPPGTDQQNQPIGVLQRGYGHDPTTVADHGVAFMKGMQHAGVASVIKHFPGLGRVHGNTDFVANVVDDVTTKDDPYLQPFRQAIEDGARFVMVALATYTKIDPSHLAVFSPTVIGILRRSMGFDGVIVSDDMGAATAVANVAPADRAVDFLEAGGDIVISKTLQPAEAMYQGVLSKTRSDPAFRHIVDAAAARVVDAKAHYGLLPCG